MLAFVGLAVAAFGVLFTLSHDAGAVARESRIEFRAFRQHQAQENGRIEKRLERIDQKLDKLLEK